MKPKIYQMIISENVVRPMIRPTCGHQGLMVPLFRGSRAPADCTACFLARMRGAM